MALDFDLLGDPVVDQENKRGRPPHVATDEKRRLVITLQAFDWSIERIAAALSITPPTLRKNYFRELKVKAEARARVEAKALGMLLDQVDSGNVAAIKELGRRFDKHDLSLLADQLKSRASSDRPKPEPKLGKKEQQRQEADGLTGMFAPPAPPNRIN